jgi:tripartite-type tricarboxylate transporter receptor subunit TctC
VRVPLSQPRSRSAPLQTDTHSLLVNSSNFVSATLYEKLSFNFIHDITGVAGIMRAPFVMVVNPSFSAKTFPEFIAYVKANPGKINFASSGIGTVPHMCGEMIKIMAGVDMVHVPYRGAPPALTDLFGGRVQVFFDVTSSSIENIAARRLRALAVTTATRFEALPDIPAVGEFLPGYEASSVTGIGAPKNTPAEIVDKLNGQINSILAQGRAASRSARTHTTPPLLDST